MKIHLAVLATLGWFALIAQFYINITSGAVPVYEIIIRYFSYFTLTTNLIVATCCTILLLKPNSRWGSFFSRQKKKNCNYCLHRNRGYYLQCNIAVFVEP